MHNLSIRSHFECSIAKLETLRTRLCANARNQSTDPFGVTLSWLALLFAVLASGLGFQEIDPGTAVTLVSRGPSKAFRASFSQGMSSSLVLFQIAMALCVFLRRQNHFKFLFSPPPPGTHPKPAIPPCAPFPRSPLHAAFAPAPPAHLGS